MVLQNSTSNINNYNDHENITDDDDNNNDNNPQARADPGSAQYYELNAASQDAVQIPMETEIEVDTWRESGGDGGAAFENDGWESIVGPS